MVLNRLLVLTKTTEYSTRFIILRVRVLDWRRADNFQMKHVGIACVASLTVGAVAAGFVIFTLSPIAMIAVVVSYLIRPGTLQSTNLLPRGQR